MATNINPIAIQQAESITNSIINSIANSSVTSADIALKNLDQYKGILFPTPYNYRDLTKITQAIDLGYSVTYMDYRGTSYTIPPGILIK